MLDFRFWVLCGVYDWRLWPCGEDLPSVSQKALDPPENYGCWRWRQEGEGLTWILLNDFSLCALISHVLILCLLVFIFAVIHLLLNFFSPHTRRYVSRKTGWKPLLEHNLLASLLTRLRNSGGMLNLFLLCVYLFTPTPSATSCLIAHRSTNFGSSILTYWWYISTDGIWSAHGWSTTIRRCSGSLRIEDVAT